MTHQTQSSLTNLDWALAYVAQGYVVIPLWPGKKIPHASRNHPETALLGSGFRIDEVGTTDPEVVRGWWGRWPAAGIGIVCGARSRLVVIDVDTDNMGEFAWEAWKAEREREGLVVPEGPVVRTPSGGYHLWFRLPEGVDVRLWDGWLDGVDVLGTGHWLGVPPTFVSKYGRSYEFIRSGTLPELPGWWLDLLRGPRVRRRSGSSGGEGDDLSDEVGPVDWDEALTPGAVPRGRQQRTLFRCAASLRGRNAPDHEALAKLREVVACFTNHRVEEPWDASTGGHADDAWERVKERYEPGSDGLDDVQREYRPQLRLVVANGEHVNGSSGGPGGVAPPTDTEVVAAYGPEDEPLPANRNTDRANAEDFVRLHRDRVAWTPDDGWVVLVDTHWRRDQLQDVMRLGVSVAEALLARRATATEEDRDRLLQRALRLESVKGITAMLRYAEHMVARPITDFDRHPWLLNCPNGTLDLRTGELRPQRAEDLLTRLCPTEYDADARDEVWERVLRDAFSDDPNKLRFFRRYLGYSLTGSTREKDFIALNGPSNTGKTTLSEPLLNVLGDVDDSGYATTWEADVIQAHSGTNRAEKLHKARGARLILVGELEKGTRMADGFVKRFTGGGSVDARALYRRSFSFRPQAKLWLDTNYVSRSSDQALHARLKLLPFTRPIQRRDERVIAHLRDDPGAHRAILADAVRGCLEWRQEGFGELPWLAHELRRFAVGSDSVTAFRYEVLKATAVPTESIHVDAAWLAYQSWSVDNVNRPLKRGKFTDAMEEHGFVRKRIGHGGPMCWMGLRARSEEEERDDEVVD